MRWLIFPFALLLLSAHAFAQLPMFGFDGGGGGNWDHSFRGEATVRVPLPVFPVVTDAPYSAESTNEQVSTLPDGVHIRNMGGFYRKVWRDALGRVRIERSLMPPPPPGAPRLTLTGVPTLALIEDPVAGVAYLLDDIHRVAHRIAGLRSVEARRREPPAQPNLGTRMIEGVLAYGTGAGGAPTKARTFETWFSPDLQMDVLTTEIDASTGSIRTEGLTNLSRNSPDPSLFTVPPDYALVEETSDFTIRWGM